MQELCKSTGSSKSLKLVVPSVTGQYKPVYGSGLLDVPAPAEAADTAPRSNHLSDPIPGALQHAHTSKSFQLRSSLTLYRHMTEQQMTHSVTHPIVSSII